MQSTSSPLGNGNSYSRLATLSPHGYPQVPFRNHSPAIQDRIHASPMPRDSSAVNLNVPLSTSRVSQGNPEERKEMWNNHKLFRSFATESNNDHEQNGEMKASQFTAVTHAETQLQKSRFLEQSRVDQSEADKASTVRELTNSFISSLPTLNIQAAKPLETYIHKPQPSGSSKSGYLLKDNEVENIIMKSLCDYLEKLKTKSDPFYENETCIKAQDESFEFKLSFRFEGDNIVFDWESKRHYPKQEYLERKYECFNYFVVDVFPDHIQLFNDFTVQPFVYTKAMENHCIRTQLRTFIPLDDPSKAVTVKCTPSEASTSRGDCSRVTEFK